MPHPPFDASIELCVDPDDHKVMLQLERSIAAKSGYKGVTKVSNKTWQARVMHRGTLRHLKSSRKPRDCAIALAQFLSAAAASAAKEERMSSLLEAAVERGKARALAAGDPRFSA